MTVPQNTSRPPDFVPPYSQEAEEYVVGAVLVTDAVFPMLNEILRPRHFFLIRLRILWQAFERIASRGEVINLTSTVEELKTLGEFDETRDYGEIIRLTGCVENPFHAETFARLVYRTSLRRNMIEEADRLRQDALNEKTDVGSILDRYDRGAIDLQHEYGLAAARRINMDEFTTDLLEMLVESEERHKINPAYVVGVRTGVTDLDLMLDGLQPGITTLAAATGVGKTGLTLQMARFAAQRGLLRQFPQPAKVHFFSGEMTQRQLGVRMLSSMTGVPARHIQRGSYTSQQKGQLEDALEVLDRGTMLTLEPGARVTTSQLRQRVRSMVIDNELDLLVLDGLLQIEAVRINPDDTKRRVDYMQRQRRDLIEEIMLDLEALTLTYKIPILMTHQISRAPAARADKRPILSDLAEASFVEHKSSVILFLYRDGYYTNNTADESAEIICRKNRFGGNGTVHQIYDAQYTRFIDADVERVRLGDD